MIQADNQAEALHLVLLLAIRVGTVWEDQKGINWAEMDFLKQAVEQYLQLAGDHLVKRANELMQNLYSLQTVKYQLSEMLAHEIR